MLADITQYERLRNTKFTHHGMVHDCAVRNYKRMERKGLKLARKRANLTQAVIAERMDVSIPQVSRWENGIDGIPSQRLPSLTKAYEASLDELLEGGDSPPAPNARVVPMEGASLERPQENLEVWGSGLGAEQEFDGEAAELTTLNTGEILEYVRRPSILNGKKGVYALYVQGSSMHPALPDGEMIVAVRDMPMSIGDNVVVYLRTDNPEEDDGQTSRGVLVKELVRRTASYVELRQYQPAKDFRVDMKQVVRIDRVLTRREMLS